MWHCRRTSVPIVSRCFIFEERARLVRIPHPSDNAFKSCIIPFVLGSPADTALDQKVPGDEQLLMGFLLEVPLWYEIQNDKCLVWEGVLAIRNASTSTVVTLAKLDRSNGSVRIIRIDLPRDVRISSEGYWTCAEVTGRMETPNKDIVDVYYHCPRPQEGCVLLDTARRMVQGRQWEMLVVRVDPDPFGVISGFERRRILNEWADMGRRIGARECVVVERKAVQ